LTDLLASGTSSHSHEESSVGELPGIEKAGLELQVRTMLVALAKCKSDNIER
jgi:hypothetical protein